MYESITMTLSDRREVLAAKHKHNQSAAKGLIGGLRKQAKTDTYWLWP